MQGCVSIIIGYVEVCTAMGQEKEEEVHVLLLVLTTDVRVNGIHSLGVGMVGVIAELEEF